MRIAEWNREAPSVQHPSRETSSVYAQRFDATGAPNSEHGKLAIL
jgi:hypothetical protein